MRPEDLQATRTLDEAPRVGISECLMGAMVRFDGGHKRDRFVMGVLDAYFDWVSMCPEVEIGMGTPRESVRLVAADDGPRMLGTRTQTDWTEKMREYSRRQVEGLQELNLSGFILKKDSPSCGMTRVRIYRDDMPRRDGSGLFAAELMRRMPNLPVEDEGRLNDPGLRENFICRVYTYQRWRHLVYSNPAPRDLIAFHTTHKLLLLAHDPSTFYRMGPLVSEAGTRDLGELLCEYEGHLMKALAQPAPAKRHINTIQHLMSFLKNMLTREDKAELLAVLADYRNGIVPLITPLTLLRSHLRRVDNPWVHQQVYLSPYPDQLALRSHL
jgi:uncharacterized protein YbgA (DUF1722 family)/uncharacterized protein YbbK (DUF523 family)